MKYITKFFKHLNTVNTHRRYVRKYCFKKGLYIQGLTHDLSKYSPTEFFTSVKYYQGNRSPILAEKEEKGYSELWLHHKGRNKHHWQYWVDWKKGETNGVPFPHLMPPKYVAEMMCDMMAASKAYHPKDWTWDKFTEYYNNNFCKERVVHEYVERFLDTIVELISLNSSNKEKDWIDSADTKFIKMVMNP